MAPVKDDRLHFGSRTRAVAAAHFLVAGIVLTAVAAWIAVGYRSGAVMDAVVHVWTARESAATVLDHGDALGALGPMGAGAAAVVLGGAAAAQFVAADYARRGRGWLICLGAGLAGVVTVVALPLAFVGAVLAYLSRARFG